ncbi:RNA polymerase sigma factor [Ammoniphilus sp. CFH 90114]|uniref:RNA polymerase sigma factor n=1 Tax=Ammoniphilus sp. CFH 90114 TaxID=2493665 RepID=UPI00100F3FF9|nr:sigma-70 family RNA polymerase sigma factor [Ammoniphilus sp. CFH 90114]RXT00624.1 sigma-70 family RNA polymerase sigma factor [Ammoniphilus sp. CFH 90114]
MKDDFMDLYDQSYEDVYRYVLFKVGNKWDADDLVSEIFRKAFERFNRLQHANAKAWLMTIARNTVIDHYRKKKDLAVGEDLDGFSYPVLFEEALEKQDDLQCLKKSLKSLDKEELEIVNLHYFSEMKYKEIGSIIGKSESAVKMKASRMIKKIGLFVKHCLEGASYE